MEKKPIKEDFNSRLQHNREFLENIKKYARAKGGSLFDLPPVDLRVEPGLVRPGETVTIRLDACGDAPPAGQLTVEADYLGSSPGKPGVLPVRWEKTKEGKWRASCRQVADRAGNWRVLWQADKYRLSRIFSVVKPGTLVVTLWVGSNRPRVDTEIHQYSLPGDCWVNTGFGRSPEQLVEQLKANARDAWSYGDRLVPFCNADDLFPGIKDRNLFRVPPEIQRDAIRQLQELWSILGLPPLEIFGCYTPSHATGGVLAELGFKALNSLCVWQNWVDGWNATDWQINQVGCPSAPYYPAADDYRKVAADRSPVAYFSMGNATDIRCYDIMCIEGLPSNSMGDLRYTSLPGIGSNVHHFYSALEGWISDTRNNAEPVFVTVGLENFYHCPESQRANAESIHYMVRRAREGKIIFASAADIADFYQRHYPAQPESVLFQPDCMAGMRTGNKPAWLPDRIEIVNPRFHSLHTKGDVLPQFLWDHMVPWHNPEWVDQREVRDGLGLVPPELIAATVNPEACVPVQADLRGVRAEIDVAQESGGIRVRARIQSNVRLNSLPLALWHLPLDGNRPIRSEGVSGNVHWLAVREGDNGNLDGVLILHDVPKGNSEYTLRLSGEIRPYATMDLNLGGVVAGRVVRLSEEARTYLWLDRQECRVTIQVKPPLGNQATVMYVNGATSTSAADGKLEIVLDETWTHGAPSVINAVPIQCGGDSEFKITRIQPILMTPFVRDWRVSPAMAGLGDLGGLEYPAAPAALKLTLRHFPGDFACIHMDVLKGVTDNSIVFYAAQFHCSSPARLVAHLGYDGPIKAWIDGRFLFLDANGTNPAFVKGEAAFEVTAGNHELLIALCANGGKAEGVILRFLWAGEARSPQEASRDVPPAIRILP